MNVYKHVVKIYCTIPARRCLTTKQGIVRGRGGTVRNIWRHLSLRSGQSHIPEHLYTFVILFTFIFYSYLGTLSKKKNDIIWEFFPTWGGGLPKSQNFFCKFTKYFFVCQIHSEVQKHVLQMGG